jgi:hypothetical protein
MQTPRPPEGFPEAVTKLRWARGCYLDQMIVFETVLDSYLFGYLGAPEIRRNLFYGTICQRLTLMQKVETMCDFIQDSGLDGQFDQLKADLKEAVTFRNRCAHAHIQPVVDDGGTFTSARATVVEWRRGSVRETAITEEEMSKRLEAVPAVIEQLRQFMSGVPQDGSLPKS